MIDLCASWRRSRQTTNSLVFRWPPLSKPRGFINDNAVAAQGRTGAPSEGRTAASACREPRRNPCPQITNPVAKRHENVYNPAHIADVSVDLRMQGRPRQSRVHPQTTASLATRRNTDIPP